MRDLLEVLFDPFELVAGDLAVLLERLELLTSVATHVPNRDPALLGPVLHYLHELLAALFGGYREGEPDDLAVVARVDTQIALLDRLLDRLDRALVVRLDDQHAGLRNVKARELLQRRFRAVVVDADLLEQRRSRAPRAHGRELLLQVLDRLLHLV